MRLRDLLAADRDRRALTLGGAVLAALIVFGRLLPAWKRWSVLRHTEVEERQRELRATRALLRAHGWLTDSVAARTVKLNFLRGRLFIGRSSAEAGAALAAEVTAIAASSAIAIDAATIRVDRAAINGVTPIGVRVAALAKTEELARWLNALESSQRLLAIREMSIARSEAVSGSGSGTTVRVELGIEALALVEDSVRASPNNTRPR